MQSPNTYYQSVQATYQVHANSLIAQQQEKYMRHHFHFYGIKSPEAKILAKELFKELGIPKGEDLKMVARLCYADAHRELHYFALLLVEKQLKKQSKEFIEFLEELIVTNSWWDSVDWLAKLVGIHFKRFPDLIIPITEDWMARTVGEYTVIPDSIWLKRVCLIFQLAYKEQTNEKLLLDYILRLSELNEFFIQKASGWALRQYSKIAPEVVKTFITTHNLPSLTVREGTKWLNKQSE